jgi:Ice-binding-like
VSAAKDDSIFWQVGSSATLGAGSAFEGDILASASITLNAGADVQCGSALASNGAVTMNSNNVSLACETMTGIPEPGTATLFGTGLFLSLVEFMRRSRKGRHKTGIGLHRFRLDLERGEGAACGRETRFRL